MMTVVRREALRFLWRVDARCPMASVEQVIEVFLHMTFYGGIAFARGAIDMANDVFAHG